VFEVEITREGRRHLNLLPTKIRDAAIQAPVPASTRPLPTSPAPTSPVLPTSRPPDPSPVTRVLATRSQVDAIAVTRQAVWLAVGGLVLQMDPATGQALAVPGADSGSRRWST
jgi:hypothetical protein